MSWQAGGLDEAASKDVFCGASVLLALGEAWSVEEVSQFIGTHYGLSGDLLQLRSERDENYLLTTADGAQRLFKLTHAAEDPAIVDFQTRALLHIAAVAPAVPVPRLVPAISGAFTTSASGTDGRLRQARLFSYLAGASLGGFRQTSAQAIELGVLGAQLDIALSGFRHPAAGHEFLWDIQHARQTRELLVHTRSRGDRDLCERTIDRFERQSAQDLAGFRTQVIHNDLNPHNVVVNPGDADRLTGIIDFGDMVCAPLINEVAVASAYLLAASTAAMGTVPEFVAAYHSLNRLESAEIAALPLLIAVRHAVTIAITNWRAAKYPDNRDYILRNQQSAVAGLYKLFSLREDVVREQLLDACSTVKR
jgi:hydroxylysine kinase